MNTVHALSSLASADPGLSARFAAVRSRSLDLAAPLSEEDCCVQSMPDASPVKWHLAHSTWFFETFVLEPFEPGFRPFDSSFRMLFNSYYTGVGERYPRPRRGLLTRPSLARIRDYRHDVDQRMRRRLQSGDGPWRELTVLGLNHEQQHQELILTDFKHLLSLNPLQPAYREGLCYGGVACGAPRWIHCEGGVVPIGATEGFCFDNELPRHETLLRPYLLAARLVSNGEYADFVESGAYRDPSLWLSEGWDWVQANAIAHPAYWAKSEAGWTEFTLSGTRTLDPDVPVSHVCYFEADAFARWSKARLPTEAEWEHAAASCRIEGNFAEDDALHPKAAEGQGLQQMFGDLWEWTCSSYAPYPGYRPAEGPIGEYNGKFMVNQYVLRGGSCATPRDHIRASYRNFFPASATWQFSGIRLAKDP